MDTTESTGFRDTVFPSTTASVSADTNSSADAIPTPKTPEDPSRRKETPKAAAAASGKNVKIPQTSAQSTRAHSPKLGLASFLSKLLSLTPLTTPLGTSQPANRHRIANGHSFAVESASLILPTNKPFFEDSSPGPDAPTPSRVALKHILIPGTDDYALPLFEIRALLHKPLLYHPNIVRLRTILWLSGEQLPTLVLELAPHGSLQSLQQRRSLSLPEKQHLLHGVAKGLSILHACKIAHCDIKAENVLVMDEKGGSGKLRAKLCDFGGAVMDGGRVRMGTALWMPPEEDGASSADGDVFSLGMAVWRCLLDGGIEGCREGWEGDVERWKENGTVQEVAIARIKAYLKKAGVDEQARKRWAYVLGQCLSSFRRRNLQAALAALGGTDLEKIPDMLAQAASAEIERQRRSAREDGAVLSGIRPENTGMLFAQESDGDYDFQENGPGSRPELDPPPAGDFAFDPPRLKPLLSWGLQVQFAEDLRQAAKAEATASPGLIPPWYAAWYLYQCYMHEFGVIFDANLACYWLLRTAQAATECKEVFRARSLIWRVHHAFGVPLGLSNVKPVLFAWLAEAGMNGYRKCFDELENISAWIVSNKCGQPKLTEENPWWPDMIGETEKPKLDAALSAIKECRRLLHTERGGIGIVCLPKQGLQRRAELDDLQALDEQIEQELSRGIFKSTNDILITRQGHRLLHYAAAQGATEAIKYLLEVRKVDVNAATKDGEAPLTTACRAGAFLAAVTLLRRGANPSGSWSHEIPFYWICSFAEDQMPLISKELLQAGASVELVRRPSSVRARRIDFDWEGLLSIPASPLLRAVIMRSLPAVKALLELGADPLVPGRVGIESVSPLLMAAILTLPEFVEVMLVHLDGKNGRTTPVFSEAEMLYCAFEKKISPATFAVMSLEGRVGRHGAKYKTAMHKTLSLLRARRQQTRTWKTITEGDSDFDERVLAMAVRLGYEDIVDSLLQLGYNVDGTVGFCPVVEAVTTNHEGIFRMLVTRGASVKIMSGTANGSYLSLLQIFAMRPRSSRPGLYIPKYLLRTGVPVDPSPDGSISAFAAAISRQDFDLADLLLYHGADVNFLYQTEDSPEWVTALSAMVQLQSEASLKSIRYLLRHPSVSVFADPEQKRTVFHVAAGSTSALETLDSHIAGRITHTLLENKSFRPFLSYGNEQLGTPLRCALKHSNHEVVEALLDAGAQPNAEDSEIDVDFTVNSTDDVRLIADFDSEMQERILRKRRELCKELLVINMNVVRDQ